MDVVYLDNNATTRPAPEVVSAMLPYLTEWYGNPSSVHRFGQRARQAVDEARGQIARLVNCAEAELLFTGGGTEAVNTAVRGILAARRPRGRIVTSTVEHSATRELCGRLAKEGAEVVEVPVDVQGSLDLDRLASVVNEETALVTLRALPAADHRRPAGKWAAGRHGERPRHRRHGQGCRVGARGDAADASCRSAAGPTGTFDPLDDPRHARQWPNRHAIT
jgi:hypothetical protein